MKPSIRSAAALTALGALASCGTTTPAQQPTTPAPVSATPTVPSAMPTPVVTQPTSQPTVPTVPTATGTTTGSTASGTPQPTTSVTVPAPVANKVHTDTVSYEAPSGKEDVVFSVTVATDGTIAAASLQNKGTHPYSVRYQNAFSSGLSGAVVGKKISDLDIRAVGGASLTTAAFVKYVRSF